MHKSLTNFDPMSGQSESDGILQAQDSFSLGAVNYLVL